MNQHREPSRREVLAGMVAGAGIPASRCAGADEPAGNSASLPQARDENIGRDPKRLQVASDLQENWTE